MGISVGVKKALRGKGLPAVEAGLEKDLRECMKCRFFYGNSSQCIAMQCVKETRQEEPDRKSQCTGCPYKQSEHFCFPCMRKIMGTWKEEEENSG